MKEKRKLDTTNKVGIAIICVIVALALTSIILHFVSFEVSIYAFVNAGLICIITGILSIIIYFATHGPHEKKKKSDDSFYGNSITVKGFFTGLGILIACGIGYIPLFILGGRNIQKMNSPAYIKTEATIMSVVDTTTDITNPTSSPRYVYYDQDGNEIISQSNAQWGGVTFKVGQKVTVYYSASNPEIMLNVSDSVMMIFGGLFFLLGGLFAFFACMGLERLGIPLFGLMFMVLPGGMLTGMILASGMNFFLLYASGALPFAMVLFLAFGVFVVTVGLIEVFKFIKFNIKERKANKEFRDYLKERDRKDKKLAEDCKNEIKATKTQKLGKDYRKITAKLDEYLEENKKAVADLKEDSKTVENKEKQKKKKKYKIKITWHAVSSLLGVILAGTVFFAVGLFVMIYVGIMPLAKTASYTKAEATVIELHTYYNKEGSLLAYFDYEYYVDGVRYEKESSYGQSAEIAPAVGETITIYYNPNNPNELTDSSWTDWIMVVVGLIFAGVGLALIVVPLVLACREDVTEATENKELQKS